MASFVFKVLRALVLIVGGVAFAACDGPSPTEGPEPRFFPRASTNSPTGGEMARPDRKDTPWQRLTDEVLADVVSDHGGRVLIGLKGPSATEGVDNLGRVLATSSDVVLAQAHLEQLGVEIEYVFDRYPVVVATISAEQVAVIRSSPYVDYLEPSISGTWASQVTPWNLTQVQAPSAWTFNTGSNVRVYVIDSGIWQDHPDLHSNVQFRCINGSLPMQDQLGHGTFVNGVIAAINNSSHVVGIAHNVHLTNANVDIGGVPDAAEVACSINVARANNAVVVNLSLNFSSASTAINDQLNSGYYQDNILFVGAAGNTNGGAVRYPATRPEVMAVTATTSSNTRWAGSAVGSQIEISAPGAQVLSTTMLDGAYSQGGYTGTSSGTSFAAPHVTAAAALVKAEHPGWSNVQIRDRLKSTALYLGPSNQYGAGLLQAYDAIAPDPLIAFINGPNEVPEGQSCQWVATTSGGTPPYQFQWSGVLWGSASTVSGEIPSPGGTLYLTVTDAAQQQVFDDLQINVDERLWECLE